MVNYTSTTDAVFGNLLAKLVNFTLLLSSFLSWDVQDLGLLVPEWSA